MYSRIGRREVAPNTREIKVPENYSGSAFNGGLIGGLGEELTDDAEATVSDMSAAPEESERNFTDPSSMESKAVACSDAIDAPEAASCALPSHMATHGNGQRAFGLDDDRLLILGLILLLSNGTLDEDMLVLLILLFL